MFNANLYTFGQYRQRLKQKTREGRKEKKMEQMCSLGG